MDIAGTKKRVQRLVKVAEESYKKISELLERMERLQEDLETTSSQVDHIEHELAEQRVLLEELAAERGLDTEKLLTAADLPTGPESGETPVEEGTAQQATSRPSASADTE